MRRVPFLAAALAVAGAAVVLGSAPLRSGALAATSSAAGRGFVGAWRLTFDTPLGASQSLLTVTADGTVLFSGRPARPAAEGVPVTSSSAPGTVSGSRPGLPPLRLPGSGSSPTGRGTS